MAAEYSQINVSFQPTGGDSRSCIIPNDEVCKALLKSGITRINGFDNPAGWNYGCGYLLFTKDDIDYFSTSQNGVGTPVYGSLSIEEYTISDVGGGATATETITIGTVYIVETTAIDYAEGDNDLYLVKIVDTRFFGVHSPKKFNPLETLEATGTNSSWLTSLFEDTVVYEINGNTAATIDATLPTTLIADYTIDHCKNLWRVNHDIYRMLKCSIYFTGSGYKIYSDDKTVASNQTLYDSISKYAIRIKNNIGSYFCPDTFRVRFLGESSGSDHETDTNAPGGLSDNQIGHIHEHCVSNIYTGSNETDLDDIGDTLGDVFYDSFESHLKFNAEFIGVHDFTPSPEITFLSFGHSLKLDKYTTIIRSLNAMKPDDGYFLSSSGTVLKLAKTNSAIAPGGSGTVSIWEDDASGDTTEDVTAYLDWIAGESISADKEVIIAKFGDIWRIIAAECESDPTALTIVNPPSSSTSITWDTATTDEKLDFIITALISFGLVSE